MIAYLNGTLAVKDPTFVVVDINGIGYHVKISLNTYSKIKGMDRCLLHTFLHVKEDAHVLYVFFDLEEKAIFQHLISINGVGPNTAMMINSSLSTEELEHAILKENVSLIQRVKGIGGKTAQRIILELKDKIKKESIGKISDISTTGSLKQEALAALQTLGINRNLAEKQIDLVISRDGNGMTLEELIKQVLKQA